MCWRATGFCPGSTVFLVFVNDLVENINCVLKEDLKMFADVERRRPLFSWLLKMEDLLMSSMQILTGCDYWHDNGKCDLM